MLHKAVSVAIFRLFRFLKVWMHAAPRFEQSDLICKTSALLMDKEWVGI